MLTVTGSKKTPLDEKVLEELMTFYSNVVLDFGTGDGRFVYENARKNPNTLFIGMDPAEKQLEIYSTKANRKKIKNCLFVVGSVENIPPELFSKIDKIYINLPWGTLLENIVKADEVFIENLTRLLKNPGSVEIILGYTQEHEPSETRRLDLPMINENFIENDLTPALEKHFSFLTARKLSKEDLGDIDTTWGKKLKFGRDRDIFKITLKK